MAIPVQIVGDGVDWPAWVQAVGSVIAIVAAFFIAQWQTTQARRHSRQDRREFRLAVAALARRLAEQVTTEAEDLIKNPAYYVHEGFSGYQYDLIDRAIDRFDPSKLASAEAVLSLEQLRRVRHSAEWYAAAVAEDYRGEAHHEDLDDQIRAWCARVNDHAATLERVARG